jgi:hypothetical protein
MKESERKIVEDRESDQERKRKRKEETNGQERM